MQPLITALPEPFRSGIHQIRSSIEALDGHSHAFSPEDVHAVISEAETALEKLEGWLLDGEQKQLLRMNHWDVYLLYASAYLWPITAVGEMPADSSDGRKQSEDPSGAENRIRPRGSFVADQWEMLGIPNRATADTIADICAAIGTDPTELQATSGDGRHELGGVMVNSPMLSAAIRLAVALNPKGAQTAAAVLGFLPDGTDLSTDAYDAAFSVTGIGPHPYLTATIQVKIECRDPEIHRALKRHERKVQHLLQRLNQTASPRFLFSEVLYEIEAVGYAPMDLKFSVDTSAALKLLTGNRLYSDNRVFLRELIQNAVDACNLRKRLDKPYTPAISVRFNDDISVVTVRDNGIGMDRQWIEKYFLTIGISLYQSSEVFQAGERSRIDLNFISQFGIGFLSSFLVAEKIVIKTRKAGSSGLMISITNLRDYFDVRPLEDDFEIGTEVTLHLKPSKTNYCRSLEYTGYLQTNVRFLKVPVRFEDHTGKVTTIGCDTLSYADPKTSVVDFEVPLAFRHSEGYLLLRAKMNVDHIFTVETAKGGISVFQDGIFITQLDTLLPEGARQHVVGRINLLGQEKCALSMDRNRIFWTDGQLREIKHTIRLGLADAAARFMAAVEAQQVAPNTRQSIIHNIAIFFDFNEVDDAIHRRLSQPVRQVVEKRFKDFLRIHFAHTRRPEGIPEAEGYSNDWQQRILDSFRKN
ncbi:MAG: ATP-binding protein [Desulfobacteraceae bacterium]